MLTHEHNHAVPKIRQRQFTTSLQLIRLELTLQDDGRAIALGDRGDAASHIRTRVWDKRYSRRNAGPYPVVDARTRPRRVVSRQTNAEHAFIDGQTLTPCNRPRTMVAVWMWSRRAFSPDGEGLLKNACHKCAIFRREPAARDAL